MIDHVPTLVSCPTCGRIQYDLIPVANEIEDFLNTIHADITVAIMDVQSMALVKQNMLILVLPVVLKKVY